ncbi:hypothetical protein BH09SUM1_BH09SUM1_05200 [soil metagenome]
MKIIQHQQAIRYVFCGILVSGFCTTARATEAPVNLRSAVNFGVLAGTTVTSTGAVGTVINGDLGIWPGTATAGFPPATVTGTQHKGDPIALAAQSDLTTAYNDAAGRSIAPHVVSGNIGGTTLHPGLHKSTSTLAISSGNLTIDGDGHDDSVFIIQIGSSFDVSDGLSVILINGASASNIYWQVGSSATIGIGAHVEGTIIAHTAITFNSGSSINGRALASTAAVTFDSTTLVAPPPPTDGSFSFDGDQQDWTFLSPAPFNVSTGVYNTQAGSLDVQTTSPNTVAYWESPTVQVTGSLNGVKGNVAPLPAFFRTTFNVSSNQATPAGVPGIRVRASAPDYHQTDMLLVTSAATNSTLSPTTTARDYVEYFAQEAGSDQLRFDFDVLNFDSADLTNVKFSLNNVLVEALDASAINAGTPVVSYNFANNANGFTFRNVAPAITAPATFASTATGLQIAGTPLAGKGTVIGNDDPVTIFGYWGLEATSVHFAANTLYRIDWTIGTDALANQSATMPTMRLRVNSSSFAVASMTNIDSHDAATREPAAGAPQTYSTFLLAPPEIAGESFIFSFDYLYTNTANDDPAIPIYLQSLAVTTIAAPAR